MPFADGPPSRIQGADVFGGRELGYVLLPRPDGCTATGTLPYIDLVEPEPDRIALRTSCKAGITVFHVVDPALELVETRFSPDFRAGHAQLERAGLLTHPLSEAEEACLSTIARLPTVADGNSPEVAARWKACE